jgi:metal-responsive CopG/Arc/MetJ family transcriptional regulator
MLGGNKIKLPKDLMEKVKKYSEIAGYTSPEEFVIHALEKEIAAIEESDSEEDTKRKLQGLGYIS